MTHQEYTEAFFNHYKLNGLVNYQRCSGKNLHYKKLLIYILRTKFQLSFTAIAKVFKNEYPNIIRHFKNMEENEELERNVENAWKLYRN